jgi:flagellar basal-body rod modification protein FlgD
MMESTGITDSAAVAVQQPTGRNLADMKPEDFFALLIAQLQTQDPMEPLSNSEIVQQISMVRDLESTTKLNNTLDELATMQAALAGQQRFGAASSLIGSYVEGLVTDEQGNSRFTAGVVTGVRFTEDGTPVLQLHDGEELEMAYVNQVTSVDEVNRIAQGLLGKTIRGEMPDESGNLVSVEGLVESIKTDEVGLPVLVLDDGTEMPLQYFKEIVSEDG